MTALAAFFVLNSLFAGFRALILTSFSRSVDKLSPGLVV